VIFMVDGMADDDMANDGAAEGFWRFSLMVYARPGVADALLRLQDRGGHNVNLVLFGLWLALCERVALDPAGLARAAAAIAGIDSTVVAPLRALRRALKPDPALDVQDLRRRVLALEIAAERRVQARLAPSAGRREARGGDRQALAEANLRLILGGDFASEEAAAVLKALSCRPSA
jgi:uncharacterized protein (TIGR02444 family)